MYVKIIDLVYHKIIIFHCLFFNMFVAQLKNMFVAQLKKYFKI